MSGRGARDDSLKGRMASTNGGCGATNGARHYARRKEEVDLDVALGVVLGLALAASLAAGWRLVAAPRRVLDPESSVMHGAVHAATSVLPHLRRGLTADSAPPAAPLLRTLTGAQAVALADRDTLLAFDGVGRRPPPAGRRAGRPGRPGQGEPRARRAAAGLRASRLPAALGDRRAARGQGPPRGRAGRALRPAGPGAPGGVARRGRGGGAGGGDDRAVRARRPGRAAGPRRAAGAARADLAALHLQRAGGGGRVHPLAPGGGARAADRVRRVHPLRVRAPAHVRHAGRRAALRGEVPAPRAGALRRPAARARAGRSRGAAGGGAGAVAAAAGGERGAPRGRVSPRGRDGGDRGRRPRLRRRAARQRRRRGHRPGAGRRGARGPRQRDRDRQRARAPALDVRRGLRARARRRPPSAGPPS